MPGGPKSNELSAARIVTIGIGSRATHQYVYVLHNTAGANTGTDPTGDFFGHDKIEGVAVLDGGRRLVISNDSDFAIEAVNETSAPFTLHATTLPSGQQDDGELLEVTRPQGTDRR